MNQLRLALIEYNDPSDKMLFVYNCNPVVTVNPEGQSIAFWTGADVGKRAH